MKKLLLLLMIAPLFVSASDADMDGVRDDRDACRNTPFWALVDSRGCTVKRINPHKNS